LLASQKHGGQKPFQGALSHIDTTIF